MRSGTRSLPGGLKPEARTGFGIALAQAGLPPLARASVTTLQVNVGRVCNQSCEHCHVSAGPWRTESLGADVAERVLHVLARNPGLQVLDITGGAPELNPHFRELVAGARALGRRVIDRCNLTVLLLPAQADLAEFLAAHSVEIVASLPCYTGENVDRQRGQDVYRRSVLALQRLNALGYGVPGSPLALDLVYNPLGAGLPGSQAQLEADYRRELAARHGVQFRRLIALANMPIGRFAEELARSSRDAEYQALLVQHFNASTVAGLMCRTLLSVDWQGRLFDCDFNQMTGLPLGAAPRSLFELDDVSLLDGAAVATAPHCFGCTAGAGSSCGGALA